MGPEGTDSQDQSTGSDESVLQPIEPNSSPCEASAEEYFEEGARDESARCREDRQLGHCGRRPLPFRPARSFRVRQPGAAPEAPPPVLIGNPRFLVIQGAK
jgi:hypothetical protein